MLGWVFWLASPFIRAWHRHRVVLACNPYGWVNILKMNRNKKCSRLLKTRMKNDERYVFVASLLGIVKVYANSFFLVSYNTVKCDNIGSYKGSFPLCFIGRGMQRGTTISASNGHPRSALAAFVVHQGADSRNHLWYRKYQILS